MFTPVKIISLDDVLPHIKGYDEFKVTKKDRYTVVNYTHQTPETFDNPETLGGQIRRECRGLIFDNEHGEIIRRSFEKFFNYKERPETQTIDLTQPHIILEKVDGSMVTPISTAGLEEANCIDSMRLATKMGITSVAMQAETWAADKQNYQDFFVFCESDLQTPIFEWVSPDNRIVLDYPEPNLILLAIRDMETGVYKSHDYLKEVSEEYNIPLVKTIDFDGDFDSFYKNIKAAEDCEGVVIAFEDGHRVKIKADQYVRIHRVVEKVKYSRNILAAIIDNELDDIMPILNDSIRKDVEDYSESFWNIFESKCEYFKQAIDFIQTNPKYSERKTVALEFIPQLRHKFDPKFIFNSISCENKGYPDMKKDMINFIKTKVGSNTNYNAMWEWLNCNEGSVDYN